MRTRKLLFGAFSAVVISSLIGTVVQARQSQQTVVDIVRAAIQQYGSPPDESSGYVAMFGCVSGPQGGAMGVHYVNGALLDAEVEPTQPEALIYEPGTNGHMQLVGAEFIVPAAVWSSAAPPKLLGQAFNFVGKPNRYNIDAFYELHVWTGKANPDGAFADWHPHVSCEKFVDAQ